MRKDRTLNGLVVLALMLAAAQVATPAAAAICGPTLGIVAMYGILVHLVRSWRTPDLVPPNCTSVATAALVVLAALGIVELVCVWSAAVHLSSLQGAAAWLVIAAAGRAYGAIASWTNRTRAAAAHA